MPQGEPDELDKSVEGQSTDKSSGTSARTMIEEVWDNLEAAAKKASSSHAGDNGESGTLDLASDDPYRKEKDGRSDKDSDKPKDAKKSPKEEAAEEPVVIVTEPVIIDIDLRYKGEEIKRLVLPLSHEVQKDDTLHKLAVERLGAGASKEEIATYEREIAGLNKIDPRKPLKEGTMLSLPGHMLDGGFVTVDDKGSWHTFRKDGSETVSKTDKTGYTRTPTPGDGYTETHTGPRPEDNFVLVRDQDGHYKVGENGEWPREAPWVTQDIKSERGQLQLLIQDKIPDAGERARFMANMIRFEQRTADREPSMDTQEIAKTYSHIRRLLEAEDNPAIPLTADDRLRIAEQVMRQAAKPNSIDQGGYNTCNVTVIESTLYTKQPSDAAQMVVDMATKGAYVTKSGVVVEVDPKSLQPGDTYAKSLQPDDGKRSHASQIFQLTAVNAYYQTHEYTYKDEKGVEKHVPAGKMHYELKPKPPGDNSDDFGERLVDHSTDPPTTVMDYSKKPPVAEDSPDLGGDRILETLNMLSGKNDNVFLANDVSISSEHKMVTRFEDSWDLHKRLDEYRRDHKFPIIMRVDPAQEPFFHDSGGGSAGGSSDSWHVITITDYDPMTGLVSIDNQWGSDSDHKGQTRISIDDLFMASRDITYQKKEDVWGNEIVMGGTAWDYAKNIESDRAAGRATQFKEFEYIRVLYANKLLSDSEFEEKMMKQLDNADAYWKKQKADGTFNQREYDLAKQKIVDLTDGMPPDKRMKFVAREYELGLIPADKMHIEFSWAAKQFYKGTHTEAEYDQFLDEMDKAIAKVPPDVAEKSRKEAINRLKPLDKLRYAERETERGKLSEALYDEAVAQSAVEFMGETHTDEEKSAFAERLKTIFAKLSDERVAAIRKTVTDRRGGK